MPDPTDAGPPTGSQAGDEPSTQIRPPSARPAPEPDPESEAEEPSTQVMPAARPPGWDEPPTLLQPGSLPGPGPDEPPTLIAPAGGAWPPIPNFWADTPTEVAGPDDLPPPPEADPDPNAEADPEADAPGPDEAGPPAVGPVDAPGRIAAVDLVRGFALCGILAMNINSFGLPLASYKHPGLVGEAVGLNRAVWLVDYLLFQEKMMTLFSMLFGAGLVLMTGRAEARGGSSAGLYYRRVGWLLLIGLAHGFLLWIGDILVAYAVCGMALYPFRRKTPRTLVILAIAALLVPVPIGLGLSAFLGEVRDAAGRVEAAKAAGQEPARPDREMAAIWADARADLEPSAEQLREEVAIYQQGGYAEIVADRAPKVAMFNLIFLPLLGVWSIGGRMLLGMALMKWGVFAASRPAGFYVKLAAFGYGLGLPLVIAGVVDTLRHDFDTIRYLGVGGLFNGFGSILVALGHASALILVYKSGALEWLTRRLAAVGRMALSNYLTHTIVCTTLFYGYGLGLFGRLERWQLVLVVVAIWAAQLWYSPIWLRRFRFGPAEWAWRSLTYWRVQPMRPAPAA